jgi:hypothetical protein
MVLGANVPLMGKAHYPPRDAAFTVMKFNEHMDDQIDARTIIMPHFAICIVIGLPLAATYKASLGGRNSHKAQHV